MQNRKKYLYIIEFYLRFDVFVSPILEGNNRMIVLYIVYKLYYIY